MVLNCGSPLSPTRFWEALRSVWISPFEDGGSMGGIECQYSGPWEVTLGLGALGCGRNRLVRGLLLGPPRSAVGCEDIRGMTGDGIGLYVAVVGVTSVLGVRGDVGVYGGGGAGFITTSGKGTPRFFSSEEEVVETAGEVGCNPRGDGTPSSRVDGDRGLGSGLLPGRSDSIFWRKVDAAPLARKSKTGLIGERMEPVGGEDCGDAKLVWSNGEAVGTAVWGGLLLSVRGGGTVRV
jgi:hypothetical protein